MGIAVIDPNVRASDGYGKTIVSLDNSFNREHSVKDMGAVFDWIKEQPNLDPDRLAIIATVSSRRLRWRMKASQSRTPRACRTSAASSPARGSDIPYPL